MLSTTERSMMSHNTELQQSLTGMAIRAHNTHEHYRGVYGVLADVFAQSLVCDAAGLLPTPEESSPAALRQRLAAITDLVQRALEHYPAPSALTDPLTPPAALTPEQARRLVRVVFTDDDTVTP